MNRDDTDPHDRQRAEQVVLDGLEAAGLDADQTGPGAWLTTLSGEWKRTLPVQLRVEDRSLHVSALLARDPDESHEDVYRYLLLRNQRVAPIHFALDDDADIVMVGWLPLEALDADAFDRLLGTLLATADEVFNAILRRGFGSYIEVEQRWREATGLPPNPVSGTD